MVHNSYKPKSKLSKECDSMDNTSVHLPTKPKQPARPVVPYLRFSSAMWNSVRGTYPNLRFNEIGKIIGAQWRKMSDAEKEPYRQEYHKDRLNFLEQMKVYKESREYIDYQTALAKRNELNQQAKKETCLSESIGEDTSKNEQYTNDDDLMSATAADIPVFSPFYEKHTQYTLTTQPILINQTSDCVSATRPYGYQLTPQSLQSERFVYDTPHWFHEGSRSASSDLIDFEIAMLTNRLSQNYEMIQNFADLVDNPVEKTCEKQVERITDNVKTIVKLRNTSHNIAADIKRDNRRHRERKEAFERSSKEFFKAYFSTDPFKGRHTPEEQSTNTAQTANEWPCNKRCRNSALKFFEMSRARCFNSDQFRTRKRHCRETEYKAALMSSMKQEPCSTEDDDYCDNVHYKSRKS